MCESTDLGQCLLKVWLKFGLWSFTYCLMEMLCLHQLWPFRTVLSVRIKISRIPPTSPTTYWILGTQWSHQWSERKTLDGQYSSLVIVYLDILVDFGFLASSRVMNFFPYVKLASSSVLVSWSGSCHQHFRLGQHRVSNLTTCAAVKSGEHHWPTFAECFSPQISICFLFAAAGMAGLDFCGPMQSQLKWFLPFTHQRLLSSWNLYWKDYSLKVSHEK